MNKKAGILTGFATAAALSGCGGSTGIDDRTDFTEPSVEKQSENVKCLTGEEIAIVSKDVCEYVNGTILKDSGLIVYIPESVNNISDKNNTVETPTIGLLPNEVAIHPEYREHYVTFTQEEEEFDKGYYINKYYSDIFVDKVEIYEAFNDGITLKIDGIDFSTGERKIILDRVYFDTIDLDKMLDSLLADSLETKSIGCDIFLDSEYFDLSEELIKNGMNVDQLIINDFEEGIIFFDKQTGEQIFNPVGNYASNYMVFLLEDADQTKTIKLGNMDVNFIK